MRSLLKPLRLNTDAKGLQFETYLDPNIDKLARRLAYEALGQSRETIRKHILDNPDVDGVVTGDEARLQQIVNNLATNACKFTPAGGKITITTKLVLPRIGDDEDALDVIFGYELPTHQQQNGSGSTATGGAAGANGNGVAADGQQTLAPPPPLSHRPLSADYLSQHNFNTSEGKRSLEHIVVRIEVSDTGCGIKMRDMMQNKLFSAFNQTEQGIQQGGKGTGLGLALVRQIVKVSGGRLGVKSKQNEGSTFWVELPLGVGGMVDPKSRNNDSQQPPAVAYGSPPLVSPDDTVPLIHGGAPGEVERQLSLSSPPPVYRQYSDPETVPLPEPRISEDLELGELTPTDHPNPAAQGARPTYVALPSPRSFSSHSVENQPPATTSTWQTSTTGSSASASSPMTAFDACFTHGSPASSNAAVNIEYGLNVLVVDDDFLTRALMTRILTRLGCKVTTAENGEIAVDLILGKKGYGAGASTPGREIEVELGRTVPESSVEHLVQSLGPVPQEIKFAVVFLDNQMPVMSGVKAVERLRELGRKDFVVGVTGNALLSDQNEYLSAGADR
ncbi:hypothetical protein EST38_g2401 [Candolleomyces aberdarensis]|uniref:histidine kinase n=1 Tax=Candolleomyces aberdarensis TaxID=2316362 RepID=A0A4Q2DSI5_9AGAR|nr:hypothetical protein EST38_g2401 [Candolleomyces aberdarensis]